MLFAVAVAFPRTISLPGTYKRLKGAVSTSDKYTAPATRAALSVGCIGFFVRPARSFRFSALDVGCWALAVCFIPESNRPPIAAQPDCCEEECRRKCQPEPETWRAQEFSRSELRERV